MTINIADIAAGIAKGYATFIEREERRQRGQARQHVYASAWHACTREMVYEMIAPEHQPVFPTNTLANFRRGNDRERDLLSDFTRAGRNAEPSFEVVGTQERFELRDHKGRVAIVGKVDARLKMNVNGTRLSCPMEVKSWNHNLVSRVETFDDLFRMRWTRRGAYQLLAYLLASNEPYGFLLLDRHGLPLLLEVELDKYLDQIEDFLMRAEKALDAAEQYRRYGDTLNITLPPFIDDAAECKHCNFYGSICQPPSMSTGAQIIVDEETIQMVERYVEIEDAGEEFEKLDKAIKKKFRGVEMAVIGDVLLEGKWSRDTRYDLTEEAEKQIETIKAPFAKKLDKGKFTLTLTKLTGAKD